MEREKASTILVAFNTLESANVYRVCAAVTEGALQVGVGLFSCVYHDTLTLPLCFCTRMKNLNKIKKKGAIVSGASAQKKKKSLSSIFSTLFPHCCLGHDSCLRLAVVCHKLCCASQPKRWLVTTLTHT